MTEQMQSPKWQWFMFNISENPSSQPGENLTSVVVCHKALVVAETTNCVRSHTAAMPVQLSNHLVAWRSQRLIQELLKVCGVCCFILLRLCSGRRKNFVLM